MADTTGNPTTNRTRTKPVIIVQGGQWGSEAKGLITHKLTLAKRVDVAIRTGTVNAGHTVYYKGKPYAMQQLPVSWVQPNCKLVLGPGAYIHPPILQRELGWIAAATGEPMAKVLERVYIDYRCGLHTQDHTDRSGKSGRHHQIGATGKGCSEAVIDKIRGRSWEEPPMFSDHATEAMKRRIVDTVKLVNEWYDNGEQLLVEGTQGTLLDLHIGDYPFTTHKQTQAASWMAEAGLSVTLPTDLWLVLRTCPIRVAGCSGVLPNEISWTMLARRLNKIGLREVVTEYALNAWTDALRRTREEDFPDAPGPEPALWTEEQRRSNREASSEMHKIALSKLDPQVVADLSRFFELTTVTRKLRRIADWDWSTFDNSIRLNRPHSLAITFMNYLHPNLWGASAQTVARSREWQGWIRAVEEHAREANLGIVSFGPSIDHTHTMVELEASK